MTKNKWYATNFICGLGSAAVTIILVRWIAQQLQWYYYFAVGGFAILCYLQGWLFAKTPIEKGEQK